MGVSVLGVLCNGVSVIGGLSNEVSMKGSLSLWKQDALTPVLTTLVWSDFIRR